MHHLGVKYQWCHTVKYEKQIQIPQKACLAKFRCYKEVEQVIRQYPNIAKIPRQQCTRHTHYYIRKGKLAEPPAHITAVFCHTVHTFIGISHQETGDKDEQWHVECVYPIVHTPIPLWHEGEKMMPQHHQQHCYSLHYINSRYAMLHVVWFVD